MRGVRRAGGWETFATVGAVGEVGGADGEAFVGSFGGLKCI